MEITDITEFERLIRNSKLGTEYKSSIIKDITNLINKNKGVGFGFINNEDFLKTVEVVLNYEQQDSEIYTQLANYLRLINNNKYYRSFIIEDMAKDKNKDAVFNFLKDESLLRATEIISNSSIQEDMKYVSTMGTILCLKDNNEQQKTSIILYALLTSYDVISTYMEQTIPDELLASRLVSNIYTEPTIPHALCINRPNNKRSDVKMSDYLLDSQMIKEDMLWLKKTNQNAFQELHDQIENIQDSEIKETFDDYCNQINSLEERKALKYTAIALAAVFIGALAVTIMTGSTSAGFIAAVTGIIAVAICGYLLCGSKLESVQLETIKNPPQHPVASK